MPTVFVAVQVLLSCADRMCVPVHSGASPCRYAAPYSFGPIRFAAFATQAIACVYGVGQIRAGSWPLSDSCNVPVMLWSAPDSYTASHRYIIFDARTKPPNEITYTVKLSC